MRRERLLWMGVTGVLAVVAFGLPGSAVQRDDDYQFVKTLIDIHRQVSVNYVDNVDENKLRDGAFAGMLSSLDPFTVYVPPEQEKAFNQALDGSFEGVGIQLNQLENGDIEVVTPIDGSPAFKAGVQAGDVITRVNGEDVSKLRLDEATRKIKGPAGSQVVLTVRRVTGQTLDLAMNRQEYSLPTVKGFDRTPDNTWNYWVSARPRIAYVRITQFTRETAGALEPVLRQLVADGMQGLVLDLRYNPGGLLDQAVEIANLFIDKGTIVSTRGRNRPEQVITASGQNTLPYFPMAVLVNQASASASEVLAGCLADNRRAVVVGTRSYGKGSVQELINLDGKAGELKMTVAYYYLPSGRLVHRKKDSTDWGVDPQVPVPVDEQTEAAVWEARLNSENFRRPSAAATQALATQPSAVEDSQLRQAVNTVNAVVLLGRK